MSAEARPQTALKYKTNGELRRDIAYTTGSDPSQYERGGTTFFSGRELARIAETIGIDATGCGQRELVKTLAAAVNEPINGLVRNLRRPQLKALHRRVGARSPHEAGDRV